jgi:hypothetical protein
VRYPVIDTITNLTTDELPVTVTRAFLRAKLGEATPAFLASVGLQDSPRVVVPFDVYAALLCHVQEEPSSLGQLRRLLTFKSNVGSVTYMGTHGASRMGTSRARQVPVDIRLVLRVGYAAPPAPPPLDAGPLGVAYATKLYRSLARKLGRHVPRGKTAQAETTAGLTLLKAQAPNVTLADYLFFAIPVFMGRWTTTTLPSLGKVLQAAPKLLGPMHAQAPFSTWAPVVQVPGTERLHDIARKAIYFGEPPPMDWLSVIADATTKHAEYVSMARVLCDDGAWLWPLPTSAPPR